jgi:hypothetical protein
MKDLIEMKRTILLICTTMILLSVSACGAPTTPGVPSSATQQQIATPSEPSGTVIEKEGPNQVLSHPNYNWTITLPENWVITYDSGYQMQAASADGQVFLRLQAQRWKQQTDRFPDARSYVEHWKDFTYGNVFPLYANGTQVSETEIGQDQFGGPYLQYEFDDSKKELRYLQVYASGGGPSSAMLSVWTSYAEYDDAKSVMQSILESFGLTETSQ